MLLLMMREKHKKVTDREPMANLTIRTTRTLTVAVTDAVVAFKLLLMWVLLFGID